MSLTTGYTTYLYCFEKDDVKIICPIAEREFEGHTDIVTPYGFSGFCGNSDFADFENHWLEFVKSKNYVCGYISLNPIFTNKTYFDTSDCTGTTELHFLDLTKSLTELYENLDTNRKRQIKDFRRAEAKFIYDKGLLTEFFITNYYDFLKRINASRANYFSESTLKYICSLENVFMVGAGSKDKIEAVYIFAYTKDCGECLFNVATPEGRHHSATLLWSGLKFFRSKKIPVMNLGGGSSTDDTIALSKQRFGSVAYPFINLRQIYDRDVYDMLTGKNPKSSGEKNYFPAYRA